MKLYICDQFDSEHCPAECTHIKPHTREVYDYDYEGDGEGSRLYCSDLNTTCYHRGDQPDCICIPVEEEV